MTVNELQSFLSKEQYMSVTTQQAKDLIRKNEASSAKEKEVLTIAGNNSLNAVSPIFPEVVCDLQVSLA